MTTTMNLGKITSASGYSSSFKPRKIVYPLPSDELPPSTDSLASSHATTWFGLTPLEMIQKIASMTINSPAYCLDTQGTQFQCGRVLIQSFVTDVPQQDMEVHAGQKRKRDGTDDSIEWDVEVDSLTRVLESVDIRSSDYTFNRWTLPVGQSNSARLYILVRELERLVELSNIEWCLPSYNRVQRAFQLNIARASGDPERSLIAVNDASCQVQALVDLVSSYPSKPILPSPTKSADLSSKAIAGDMKARTAKFQNHMTVWIVNNWQNPFPDDDMFEYLANFMINNQSVPLSSKDATRLDSGESLFIITTEKIVNWLVNFRTRRWRPVRDSACNDYLPVTPFIAADMYCSTTTTTIPDNRAGIRPTPTGIIASRRFSPNF